MGQAKRRKEQLGDLYGAPKAERNISFCWISPENLRLMSESLADSIEKLPGGNAVAVEAMCDGEVIMLGVRPVIDERGQFNSGVYVFREKGSDFELSTGDHRKLNQYLLENADVVITAI